MKPPACPRSGVKPRQAPVKWIKSIEWITDYAAYGDGRGGTREDAAMQAFNGRI